MIMKLMDNPTDIWRIRLGVVTILMWFGAVHFEEVSVLNQSGNKQLESGHLLVTFDKGQGNQFKQRFEIMVNSGFMASFKFHPDRLVLVYQNMFGSKMVKSKELFRFNGEFDGEQSLLVKQ